MFLPKDQVQHLDVCKLPSTRHCWETQRPRSVGRNTGRGSDGSDSSLCAVRSVSPQGRSPQSLRKVMWTGSESTGGPQDEPACELNYRNPEAGLLKSSYHENISKQQARMAEAPNQTSFEWSNSQLVSTQFVFSSRHPHQINIPSSPSHSETLCDPSWDL